MLPLVRSGWRKGFLSAFRLRLESEKSLGLTSSVKMPRNVEIKASVKEVGRLEKLVYELTESLGTVLNQEDTFFNVPNGRLKLRVLDANPNGQLIHYQRTDQAGPKQSTWSLCEVEDAAALRETLAKAVGILGTVKKQRKLYFCGQTRIHLDTVEGLGSFMELEVVLEEGQTAEDGEKEAKRIMDRLEIKDEDLQSTAYMDIILKNQS